MYCLSKVVLTSDLHLFELSVCVVLFVLDPVVPAHSSALGDLNALRNDQM